MEAISLSRRCAAERANVEIREMIGVANTSALFFGFDLALRDPHAICSNSRIILLQRRSDLLSLLFSVKALQTQRRFPDLHVRYPYTLSYWYLVVDQETCQIR